MNSDQLILDIAKHTLSIEIRALEQLRQCLDIAFVNAVRCIAQCKGRVVLTGIGKSALVAQKIVATLNSTGTQSLFMHAADAVHGDLGMLGKDDVLWCLSKSGDTAELRVLVPLVQQMGNPIIASVSKPESYLAKTVDFALHIPIEKEADPNNLAPTASTTAQMALGDAVAMSLLAIRGFSPQDFSKFHPGGSLGKQLYLKAADLYPQNQRPMVQAHSDLKTIILSMTSGRLGMTVVVDADEQPIGVITDGDLRRMLEGVKTIEGILAHEIMTSEPLSLPSDNLAIKALSIMREKSITQLIVVEDGKYVGVIHLHDLVREGII